MTNPFSEAYRKLCEQYQKILREEWEPRLGDYVIAKESKHTAIVLHSQPEQFEWGEGAPKTDMVYLLFFPGVLEKMMVSGIGESWGAPVIKYRKLDVIPLPTQRQLQTMIEERGYLWDLGTRHIPTPAEQRYRCAVFTQAEVNHFIASQGVSWHPCHAKIVWLGPDPKTALLKCLLEVMEKDECDRRGMAI